MTVDPNLFIKEVAVRLCGHLDIAAGMQGCLRYLAEVMPADALYLQQFERSLGSVRVVARATADRAEAMDVLVTLPAVARSALDTVEAAFRVGGSQPALMVNDPSGDPVTSRLQEVLGVPPSSALGLPVVVEGQALVTLALLAEGTGRYAREHVRLFSLLRDPLYVALANVHEHRRALSLAREGTLRLEDLTAAMAPQEPIPEPIEPEATLDLDAVVAAHIRKVLELTGGQVQGEGGAAELLGINPSTLRSRMKKLGIAYGRA